MNKLNKLNNLSSLVFPLANHRPSHLIRNLEKFPVEDFLDKNKHIRGITYDLDRTVVGMHGMEPSEAMLDIFERFYSHGLKRGHDVKQGFISNAPTPERTDRVFAIARRIVESTGIIFEVITSLDAHVSKPHPAIFRLAAERMGLKPEQLAHVGDQSMKDVKGANEAGYGAAIQVAPYTGPEGFDEHVGVLLAQRPVEAIIRGFALDMPFLAAKFPEKMITL